MFKHFDEFRSKDIAELIKISEELQIDLGSYNKKQNIIFSILNKINENEDKIIGSGVLDINQENNFGFLRYVDDNYTQSPVDIYISPNQVKKLGLKAGDLIEGQIKAPKDSEKYIAMHKINFINQIPVSEIFRHRSSFEKLTPIYPNERLNLEVEDAIDGKLNTGMAPRIIDLIAPIGKGQRALIVSPPKVGKTMMLVDIANSIVKNHPECYIIILLIDERPEEVTDISRLVKAEVVSSTFDEPAEVHAKVADIVIERAKRLVEHKKDVVILLDSMTRLARAYNNITTPSGRVLTGGIDAKGLEKPKKFFGTARNIEEGGSLTIIASSLIETGSKMDEVIFEEFKGTGNCEVVMDRKIAEKGIYPAIDVVKSGTRREDMMLDKDTLTKMQFLRKYLNQMTSIEAIDFLISKIKNTKNNNDFFNSMNS